MGSLKSFIKAVRASKSIADERATIRKESAAIRTSFRDVNLDQKKRKVNITKLLYLYILGEPTHFGQVECLKLLVSNQFADKRLGYMAAMLILDENQEVLTLLTNSLNNDITSDNQYVAGLALVTLGNIASPELARDLYPDVEKVISCPNSYLRKKAILVASKLVDKNGELSEIFAEKVPTLLSERNHGCLMSALSLLQSVYVADGECHTMAMEQIPKILSHLKSLSTTGFTPEYDVAGVADPFLYVKLIETLRLLYEGKQDAPFLEQTNDALTQVVSKVDTTKNAGNAVLYEAVKAIFRINTDPGVRVLGVNVLGKFLSIKDNNTRYVALNTLLSVMSQEPDAVQRHRSTIVGCLQDGDVSIRRRALELAFAIVNSQNIRVITKELLAFLSTADRDLKVYLTTQLTLACETHSPNEKWHFETMVKMLTSAGNYVNTDILSNIIASIMQIHDQELLVHVVMQLYEASSSDTSQYGLALVTIWCLGEYGDLVVGQLGDDKILHLLQLLLTEHSSSSHQLTSYVLTASLKLSTKFENAKCLEGLRQILKSKSNDIGLENQIRALEYLDIFEQPDSVKRGLLERMPPPKIKVREGVSLNGAHKPAVSKSTHSNDLLDLLGDDILTSSHNSHPTKADVDLLSDIFGSGTKIKESSPEVVAYENDTVAVYFSQDNSGEGTMAVTGLIVNKSSVPLSDVSLLAAVPKSQKLHLSSISSNTVRVGSRVMQPMKIEGKPGSKLKLRLKLNYTAEGENHIEQFDFAGFTKTL